ncbi:zinc finger, CCHC-type containing protein [Tanacetum coccineum]|uniref:Zinc finger, CCHC-type containing protein n=1 Tax=Tanacetum coccineum TaxID=301880 RepID=A0ABQ5DN62_9ASTR
MKAARTTQETAGAFLNDLNKATLAYSGHTSVVDATPLSLDVPDEDEDIIGQEAAHGFLPLDRDKRRHQHGTAKSLPYNRLLTRPSIGRQTPPPGVTIWRRSGGKTFPRRLKRLSGDPVLAAFEMRCFIFISCLVCTEARPQDIREYPSLIDTFWRTHTVDGEEMKRLEATGEYTEDEINALARGGKLRGHIPGVGRKRIPSTRIMLMEFEFGWCLAGGSGTWRVGVVMTRGAGGDDEDGDSDMTTSVGNNSVFRSFFEKQKLTGPNFIDWYRQLRLVLSTEDKENYLEHPIPVAPVAQPGQQVPPEALAAHAAWVKGQKEVVVLMLLTMDLDIQRNLAHLGAYDMLQELKAMFSKQAEQELLQTVREFHTCKQEEGQSVSSHVLKMKGYIDNLERLGQPVGQNLAVSLILVSLNKDFTSFVQNFNMHGMGKTVNELHAMLKLHEESLPKKDANPALHAIRAGRVQKNQKNKPHKAGKGGQGKGKNKMGYAHNNVPFAPKPKTPPPPKKDNPAKDAICHQCGEVGHWRRNCPVYLTELMKKKKLPQGASTSGIFTIELYSFPSKSWIYDTGCGTHICITTQGLRGSRKLKPGALSLYVGDGHRAAVEAIGTYHLELPSGLVIVLNNCHYAPSITRGVISVSRLFDDGFVNRFDDNNVISVSKDNLVYFMAVPRDGIFEIDMSCSNTNDSSMYAITNKRAKINLDSSLLWHCRLGHISKKRIEKLQHDGLLNSIDIESLGKCVSCLSGKMARKPYSHQVERAKDLLGLIHTDVCGPFRIVSRQGASYFVTFTDDFSRYGYVYLLKHKHEVFDTFKVFQKEVENQLGKTIKSLRSDRGGEYMSQEFLDHLKKHGIIAHRIPPYTPQNNGVSERRNRTLLDMVRSMMSQTTLPKSFWDYALETAARILNMVPTKKVDKTPYEIWHGQALKLSYLKV